jgi:hypothetical protein
MSCLGPGYNPNPPRAWSRVQGQCSYNLNPPTSGQPININIYQQENQMLLKGNILQYKKNSSSLTKKQRYSQIAKGLWTNRTKNWASQSQTSTNPNISSLQRVNYGIIPLIEPITDSFGCTINFLKDGGSLVCNTYVNPCTDEVIEKTRTNQCNMSSASDVPGPEVPLCWDNRVQTWYPRQNLTMNNSGNKWPVNYKLFKSSNSLVSGTEVSQDFLYGKNVDSLTRGTNTLNNFNINNIYSTTASLASININLFTSYYNEFMKNAIIIQINGYLKTFIDNPTGISMSVTQYSEMNMGLTSLKTGVQPSSALYDIIGKYTLMLDSLYQSNSLNSSLQGTTSSLEKYKIDSEILNDVSKLQLYLDELKNTYNIFEPITVNSIETVTIKEPYNTYNLIYGIPQNLEYDPDKLLNISQSLGL